MQKWMKLDREYETVWRRMKERMKEEQREARGKDGWWERADEGKKRGRESFDIRYPKSRKERDGRDRRRGGKREGLRL